MDLDLIFYTASAISILATIMVITRTNGVHALLWLILSLLSVAMVFYTLGAPFLAVLEVIIYAGAIMVLFIFVVMMLNLGKESVSYERKILSPGMWIAPTIFAVILFVELVLLLSSGEPEVIQPRKIDPQEIGLYLYGPYVLAVQLAAMLLMAGIIGAYHLGRKRKKAIHRYIKEEMSHGSTY